MNNKQPNVRRLAHASLLAIMKSGRYSNIEIDTALKRASELSDSDRGLYTRLVYGVIERRITLDHIIASLSSRPVSDIDPASLTSLRLGIYQLLYTDRIPDFAAVSETVDTSPSRSKGFVNGVLRSFLRSGKKISLPEGTSPEALSVRYSASVGICRLLSESYGTHEAEQILEAFFAADRICLRINTLKISVADAESKLNGAEPGSYADDILRVPYVDSAVRGGIEEGLWFVQDEASRICTAVLGARCGERIADVCSAPGGKAFSAAIDAENKGELFSFDLHKNKLSLIRSTAERLGLDSIIAEARDAREPKDELAGTCHRVLCDAPCSGLGVLAKKPDIRYRDDDSALRLPAIQKAVLEGASKYVKPGGVLVYSTCTLNKKENEDVVSAFMRDNPDFAPAEWSIKGKGYPDLNSRDGMLTLFPHIHGTDGFFVAKMIKNI